MGKIDIQRAARARQFAILGLLGLCSLPVRAAAPLDNDMKILNDRMVASLVLTTPELVQKAKAEARAQMTQLQPDGSWPDIDYTDQTGGAWKPNAHLRRLQSMARALKSPASALFNDAPLQGQTLLALRGWLQKDPHSSNWWHNQIGAPQQIGGIALLLQADLSADAKAGVIRILDRALLAQTKPISRRAKTWSGSRAIKS